MITIHFNKFNLKASLKSNLVNNWEISCGGVSAIRVSVVIVKAQNASEAIPD